MRWSKNIHEERDAPEQIVLGSMDPKMCALLNLAVYIETSTNVSNSEFIYGHPKDGNRVVRRFLGDIITNTAFKNMKTGKLGTHSFRKGAATYASRCGMSKVFVNRRGRWRTRKGVVDVYIDNTQPYPDACTAAALAGPLGPCFYVRKHGIDCVSPTLLVDQIAPTIKQVMGEAVATTLAMPLLWAAMEPSDNYTYELIPDRLKQKIIGAYVNSGGNSATDVNRRGIIAGSSTGGEGSRREFAALHSQYAAVQRSVSELMSEMQRSRHENQRELQKIQAILKRVMMQPAVRLDAPSHVVVYPEKRVARLSKRPKDLFELWHEFQFGNGGLKPAKDFTPVERGANKFAFSRRKVFWDIVATLIRSGYTSDTAIDKIYAVYGRQLPVSSILTALRADRRQGGHASLRL
ncbi:hypothetical protein PPTG_13046 [Phytophthora nicotianae INRA-310]|uniref:Uncharacterized protein n=1 Tax=Phytophthora nicotianae (strain INRA-310) TaxID=761204 RepID=W2Q637_PHYN3|nr:hypothetical protein PPTG_13046 [Phytophthora nicotianae INRA-310]ETN07720.1 hypothetical protein PPTG_13046 [Phytophthora nicotianae INRA-310]